MTPALDNVPAEIVRRLLERGSAIAAKSAAQADGLASARERLRRSLAHLIHPVDDSILEGVPSPSVSAVDGGCVCDSRSIGDICTAAAIRVDAMGEQSDCDVWMDVVTRAAGNKEALSAVMRSMELLMASACPSDVVMVDGSIHSALIAFSKAMREAPNGPLKDRIEELRGPALRAAVLGLLKSNRHIALPKYTTTNEFAKVDGYPEDLAGHDARTVATMTLLPGEMTSLAPREELDPRSGLADRRRGLIGPAFGFDRAEMEEFDVSALAFGTCYYRPHPWTPAFRIDMPHNEGEVQVRALRAVRDSTMGSGLREPFPLYLVDQFAKQVSAGAASVVDMAALEVASDPEARFLIAMGYRT